VLPTLYGLFALGGACALVYEVLWMRSFRLVFGSSTRSAAAVLAAYFAGMAVGNWLGARLAHRARPVRLYGRCEIGVGLSALLVAPWLGLFDSLYPALYAWAAARPALLSLGKLVLAAVALAPPAIAMGATLPLATRAVVARAEHVAQRTGALYALNVLGATAGALLAAFVLPNALGIRRSIYLAAGMNLAIGIAALRLAARIQAGEDTCAPAAAAGPRQRPAGALLFAAAVSGFGTLALEVVFVRLLSQRSEGSVYTFGLLLAIFLLFLAVGSLWVSRRLDRADPWRFLAWTQAGAVLAILLSPYLFELIPLLALYSKEDTLGVRLLRFGAGSLFVLGPPVALAAVVLPSTWKLAVRSASAAGEQVGLLTALNTLAGVAGSLAAGFVLLPWVGLGGSVLAVAGLYASLALVASTRAFSGARRLAAAAACLAIPLAWWGLGAWRLVLQPLEPGQRLLRYRDGETATVAVLASREGHRLLTLNHAYLLGSTAAGEREVQQGRLPLLLHPRPARVALVGVATGMTASAVLDFPVERAVAVEIVPGVVDVLPEFAPWNRAFFRDPRVELVVADGRNHLRGTRERFDVVIGDLFVPWHAGTGDLYALEHFDAVAKRLAPGGLFAQWLPGYQLTPEELRTIAATFLAVFPRTTFWRADFHAEQPVLALVGRLDGAPLDPQALAEGCQRLAAAQAPPAPFLSSPSGVRLLYVAGDAALREWAQGAPLNTDDRPLIEYGSPRSVFEQRQRSLPIQRVVGELQARSASDEAALPLERPLEEVVRAADLLQQATLAHAEHNFEREYRLLTSLAAGSADLRGVAAALVLAAARYRERNMPERSQELLAAVVATPRPPLGALLALAEQRRAAGRDAEAAELLERALDAAPEAESLRRSLADLLLEADEYARAEPHLRRLLERGDDAELRVELAYVLDRQGRREDAAAEVTRVRALPDPEQRQAVFRHLQRRGLGAYLDSGPPP
jgi:spermidine synthase